MACVRSSVMGTTYPANRAASGSSVPELVAAPGEVRRLGGVAGQLDRPVVGRPRVLHATQSAQEVGAGGVEGVVAVECGGEAVDRGKPDVGPVHLGHGDRSVEGD